MRGSRAARLRVGFLVGTLAGLAGAQEESAGFAYELTHELMSPFGEVRHSIADCPSSVGLVQWIVEQEKLGKTRDEVEAALYARFGEILRGAPKAEGFGLAAYAIPVLVALAGAALVIFFLRRQVRNRPQRVEQAPLDPELERLVDEELSDGS